MFSKIARLQVGVRVCNLTLTIQQKAKSCLGFQDSFSVSYSVFDFPLRTSPHRVGEFLHHKSAATLVTALCLFMRVFYRVGFMGFLSLVLLSLLKSVFQLFMSEVVMTSLLEKRVIVNWTFSYFSFIFLPPLNVLTLQCFRRRCNWCSSRRV